MACGLKWFLVDDSSWKSLLLGCEVLFCEQPSPAAEGGAPLWMAAPSGLLMCCQLSLNVLVMVLVW